MNEFVHQSLAMSQCFSSSNSAAPYSLPLYEPLLAPVLMSSSSAASPPGGMSHYLSMSRQVLREQWPLILANTLEWYDEVSVDDP